MVSNLVVVYSSSSYSNIGVGDYCLGISLVVGAGVGISLIIFTLGYLYFLGGLLYGLSIVSSILGLVALFLRGLVGSVCCLNISTSCLSVCSFSSSIGLVRASTRSKALLVAASLADSPGIFVFYGKKSTVLSVRSTRILLM